MQSKNCQILLLLTWIFICMAPTVYAAEVTDLKGRITAGINLRAAPGLSGKLITGLEAGTVVIVTGEQAGWYQIAYENETYGYRGWVYGKYVELLAAPVTPVVPAEAPAPMPVMTQPPQPPAAETHILPVEMPANTIELIQAAAPPETEAAQQPAASMPASVAQVKSAPAPAPPQPIKTQTDLQPAPDSSGASYPVPAPGYLLSIVLKISSVFLSCLALLISYRTFQMVTATSRTT